MDRKETLLHLWDTAYDIEGWHPPLRDALHDLDYTAALWRPHPDAHNIWELLNHLVTYKDRFLCRLEGKTFDPAITDNEKTFTRGNGTTAAEWSDRVAHLVSIQATIRQKVMESSEDDFDRPLPEAPVDAQLLSLCSHDSYHTGQIMLLRKLQGSWPATRAV